MEFHQNPARAVFAWQPARILLVDFSPPFSSGLCQSICDGLENLFTFVCNLTGPCRVPYFGLFALGSYSENLFPLQYVPGNYPRINNALEELRAFGRDGFLMNQQKTFLLQAVKEAILQFKKQSQTLRQTTGFAAQLEVVLMTCQTSISNTAKQIEEAVSESLDTENLRRIQLVSLAHEGPVISIPQGLSPSPKQPASQHSSLSSDGVWDSGLVELISLATDNLSMENFFRGWLLDSGTDKECLYITFPTEGGKEDLKLTCDLQEPFIDPSYLPGVQGEFALNLISTSNQKQMSAGMQMKPTATSTVPIHTLRVIKLVQIGGICESVLFGVPLILKPTACWKLPWDELERNQQLFQGMCHLLQEKELAILAKKDTPPPPSYSKVGGGVYLKPSSSRPITTPSSAGHFLILPSHGMSMLVKSVAVKELMLPSDAHEKGEPPLSDTLETVQKVLEKIETVDVFNPLLVSSGLHNNLKKMLSKGAVRRTAKVHRGQIETVDVFNPLLVSSGLHNNLKKMLSKGAVRRTAKVHRGQQMSRSQPLSRGTRGQITRGQSSRSQRSRGRSAGPSMMVQRKDYSPPVSRFEKFFPDFED